VPSVDVPVDVPLDVSVVPLVSAVVSVVFSVVVSRSSSLLVVDAVVVVVRTDEVARVEVVVERGVVVAARGGVPVARGEVALVRDGAEAVFGRVAVRSAGLAGVDVVGGATAEAGGLGVVVGGAVGGTTEARAAPNGTGTPMATAVPPDRASTIRVPSAVAATAAGHLLVDGDPEPISPGATACRDPSAPTARTSRRSSTVS
jgi:hypothetical protein